MRTLLHIGLLIVLLVAPCAALRAQTPTPTPAPPGPVVTEIVVTGERPAVETRVDRKVYSISRDLQAPLGSAADVLRNIPSVSVDLDGIPSLRGDSSVQIFIDGRPAPEFNGANRGAALEQLSADGIERIEVLTNPPANFKREGTAGIINIVTKQPMSARSAAARASLGSGGRYNAGTSHGIHTEKLNLRGSASFRHDRRIRDLEDDRVVRDPATGETLTERQSDAAGENDRVAKNVSLGVDYDLSAHDRIGVEGGFHRRDTRSHFDEHNRLLDSAGELTENSLRHWQSDEYEYNSDAALNWHHSGQREGDGVDLDARRSESREHTPRRFTDSYLLPVSPDTFQDQDIQENEVATELSIEGTRTLAPKARFVAGYDLERVEGLLDLVQTIPAVAGEPHVPDPGLSNGYRHSQTIHALYASYERPLGAWTVLAGVRAEQADVEFAQDYFRVYPSLHFADALDENHTLTFSYSRRVSRPYWQDLNPNVVRQNPTAFRQGNPALEPSEVDSLEAGWSFERGPSSWSATLYARRSHDDVTYVTTPISDTIVLTRPENLGESVSGGFELSAAGRLWPNLDYTLSGNVYYNEIDAGNLGFEGTRSTLAYEAKAALNWRASPRHRMQLNLSTLGKQLTAQGYRRGSTVLDAGYRFQLRPNFALVATVSDLFESRRDRTVLDSPAIYYASETRAPGRIVFVGFSWSRAADKNPEQFEFDK